MVRIITRMLSLARRPYSIPTVTIVVYVGVIVYFVFDYYSTLSIDSVIYVSSLLLTIEGILLGLGSLKKRSVAASSLALGSILYSLFVITLGEISKTPQGSPVTAQGVAVLFVITILFFASTITTYTFVITRD